MSRVAANSGVRAEMRARQRAWAELRGGGVIEGRDIGSVVFPEAELKLYLTASPRVRAERRVSEMGSGDVDEIEASIVVDTTGLTVGEVLDQILRLLEHA